MKRVIHIVIYASSFCLTFLFAWLVAGSVQRDTERTAIMAAVSPGGVPEEERWVPAFARETALDNVAVRVSAEERKARAEKEARERKKEEKSRQDKKPAADADRRTYILKNVPPGNEVKKYERYTLLTSWKQADLQKLAHTDENGMRKVGNRYCVALGSYYTTEIGTEFDLIMQDGDVIPCILGDAKSDLHTDALHQRGQNGGCVAEFIVDDKKMPAAARTGGSVHFIPEFAGEISKIRIYMD